jgi:hypothetical protein
MGGIKPIKPVNLRITNAIVKAHAPVQYVLRRTTRYEPSETERMLRAAKRHRGAKITLAKVTKET